METIQRSLNVLNTFISF